MSPISYLYLVWEELLTDILTVSNYTKGHAIYIPSFLKLISHLLVYTHHCEWLDNFVP